MAPWIINITNCNAVNHFKLPFFALFRGFCICFIFIIALLNNSFKMYSICIFSFIHLHQNIFYILNLLGIQLAWLCFGIMMLQCYQAERWRMTISVRKGNFISFHIQHRHSLTHTIVKPFASSSLTQSWATIKYIISHYITIFIIYLRYEINLAESYLILLVFLSLLPWS